jgi:CheY-like chemotaxis protein
MPNKDGYQACREIRRWEKKQGWRRHPIIALSANVLGDVYAKCVEAGFNSYVTKPVEFPKLSMVLAKFLDPKDPTKAPEFMAKPRRS